MKLERPAPRRALEIGLSLGLVLILVLWAAVLFWTEEDREATVYARIESILPVMLEPVI